MAQTNEFERDLVNQAQLKHPGRIDMIVFQNIPDVGDGSPGIQRCFRNYLHEGGMEKDLQLLGFGIKGTSVDINNAELQQLSNIGASVITSNEWAQIANIGDSVTINVSQWGYVGALNQGLTQNSNVVFGQITMSGDIIMGSDDITFTAGGLVDGVDVGSHDHSGITNGVVVPFSSLSGDIIYNQLDSLVDTSGVGSANLISGAQHVHTSVDGSSKIDHINLNSIGNNTHTQIDTHIVTSNPHVITLDKAFDGGKIINGANSSANSFQVGNGSNEISFYYDIANYISSDATLYLQTVGGQLIIKTTTSNSILFYTNNTYRWIINENGDLLPNGANTYDIGNGSSEVGELWYCTSQDTTCADLSDYSIEDLYQLFNQIKPMTDGGLHYSKSSDNIFPHIDFKTLPREFSTPAPEDMIKNNVWEIDKKGEIVTRNVHYKKGDTIAIDAGTYTYALGNLVVKSYEKIKELERQIELLKNN